MFSLAFAMLIGMIIPFLAIYLQDFFNNKIENKKQIQNLLRVPFLGTVKTNKALKKRTSEKEFSLSNTDEDFQTLRSNLQYALKDRKSPVISVTSLIDHEGKTYIAANLAKSLASISKKTVLLDIDMQRSDLSKQFGLFGSTKGLVDYVCSPDLEIKDILAPYNGDANLSIIPSGKLTTNTADILMSGRLDELINELKNRGIESFLLPEKI